MTSTWRHLCKLTYAGGVRPALIDIQGLERCPYCGEVSPVRQAEVDALAVEILTKERDRVKVGHDDTHALDMI